MFLGLIPGSVGETSTFLILLGAAFLIFTKIGSWRIIVIYICWCMQLWDLIFNQVAAAMLLWIVVSFMD